MDCSSEILRLKNLGNSFEFIEQMKNISCKAAEGDPNAMQLLESMLDECSETESWLKNRKYCSAILNALIRTKTPYSMKIILTFIKNLPESIPYGCIELIANLLPLYRKIVIGPAREMSRNENKLSVKAVGIQTLCNLYLDGTLDSENTRFLEGLSKKFQPDRYLTQSILDLVRIQMSRRTQETVVDPDDIPDFMLDSFLVDGAK